MILHDELSTCVPFRSRIGDGDGGVFLLREAIALCGGRRCRGEAMAACGIRRRRHPREI